MDYIQTELKKGRKIEEIVRDRIGKCLTCQHKGNFDICGTAKMRGYMNIPFEITECSKYFKVGHKKIKNSSGKCPYKRTVEQIDRPCFEFEKGVVVKVGDCDCIECHYNKNSTSKYIVCSYDLDEL